MHLGDTASGLNALHRSLRLAGDNVEVLFNASIIYSLAGQWPVALSYIEQSLTQQLNPVWFKLPWFDKLCHSESEAFEKLLDEANKRHQYSSNRSTNRCL